MKWLERTGIFPVLFFFLVILSLSAAKAKDLSAQGFVRAWQPWRTVETNRFRFNYPVELEAWTRALASRSDAIDSAVAAIVGYAPSRKTDVVVDDPYNVSNGSAWPFLNRPVISLWATPPDPREDIGEYNDWGRTLFAHEFTHIAHLSRPSRNSLMRRFWQFTAVDLGPITLNAPRWVIEGYATYAEGRVTGSGRPHGSWRPAYLREWALEGQLPPYDQLDSFGSYDGGEFVYLAGSAFLEWLAERNGDSSLVNVWRRMTAKQTRGFDEAFTGVFGESARALYGRFTTELTGKSLEIQNALRATGFPTDTGEIVQRLAWGTGDPAISRDGKRIAIALASPAQPSRIVIWSTAAEPDTGRARRDSLLRKSDPEDVPARSIYPPPKRVLAILRTSSGTAYQSPRFLPDGRVLVTRMLRQSDGSMRPDLFVWNPSRRRVDRITRGASVRDGDPAPDGRSAIATRCLHGWCDVVMVRLATGAETVVLGGSPERSYFRPRLSPDGKRILVSVNETGRWRLIITDLAGGDTKELPLAGNAYDGSWAGPNDVIATTDGSGIANLALVDVAANRAVQVTRVTGAAVGAERSPADSSIWFLSLYSRGYDLRRIRDFRPRDTTTIAENPSLVPAARIQPVNRPAFGVNAVSSPRSFDLGQRLFRWFPLPEGDADGATGVLALTSMDIIGRSEIVGKIAAGDQAAWHGGALDFTWRGLRPFLRGGLFDAMQTLRVTRSPFVGLRRLDTHMRGGLFVADQTWTSESWSARARLGASAASLIDTSSSRTLMVGDVGIGAIQRTGPSGFSESLSGSMTVGNSFGERFWRGGAAGGITAFGYLPFPLAASVSYARTNDDAPLFEQMSLGGNPPALIDRLLLTQRIVMPVLPLGVAIGTSAFTYRVSLNTQPLNVYFWSGSTAPAGDAFSAWNRVVGLEGSQGVSAIPLAGVPTARAVYGIGKSLDAPFRGKVRAYVSLVLNP